MRFWLTHGLLPLLVFLIAAYLFEITDWDIILSNQFFDVEKQSWIYKDTFWARDILHTAGRYLIAVIGIGSFTFWIASFQVDFLRAEKSIFLYIALTIGISTGLVGILKILTHHHCPYEFDLFGGPVPYVKLFDLELAIPKAGRCFPSAHASAGFSLFGFYFVMYKRNPRQRGLVFFVVMIVGTMFSLSQIARGAHFVSHNIWSAAICWFVALFAYKIMLKDGDNSEERFHEPKSQMLNSP